MAFPEPRPQGLFTSSIGLEAPLLGPGSPHKSNMPSDLNVPLNVLIPMGGLKKTGVVPQPLRNIVGRPIIFWLIDHLSLRSGDSVWIGLPKEVDEYFALGKHCKNEFPNININIVRLQYATSGPIETIHVMLQSMDEQDRNRRTVSIDSANLYFSDILGAFRGVAEGQGASFYFVQSDDAEDSSFSYIKMNAGTISDIKEKVLISNFANTGVYGFPSATALLEVCETVLDNPQKSPGKTYLSGAIKLMIDAGTTFVGIHVPSFACVSSKEKLDDFLAHLKAGTAPLVLRRIRFCFDLDGTLVSPPRVSGDWSSVTPIEKNVELVRQLKEAGHHIIIQTSRGMKASSGNLGAVMRDVGAATFQTLCDFNIPYDEIIFGQPEADIYIGQRHVSSIMDICSEIGWFVSPETRKGLEGAVAPRDFNTVKPVDDSHVFKSGPTDIMRGEVYWYRNIPAELSELFPSVLSIDGGEPGEPGGRAVSIVMSKIEGVTYSQLVVSGAVTAGRLRLLLDSLHQIHSFKASSLNNLIEAEGASDGASGGAGDKPTAQELEQNYGPKVRGRFEKHQQLYQSFIGDIPELNDMFTLISEFLDKYISEERFRVSDFIHGDPVLSNILLEKQSSSSLQQQVTNTGAASRTTRLGGVKFIDMRGALGNRLTTAGDVNYDLSKLFQSLNGYDFMLLDVYNEMNSSQRKTLVKLQDMFWKSIREFYCESDGEFDELRRDITLLTAAHFFTIVPLHETRDRQLLYLQQSRHLLRACELL